MAAVRAREGTSPPFICKAGRYTVFLTPPATPKLSEPMRSISRPIPAPIPELSAAAGPPLQKQRPEVKAKAPPSPPLPPVQVPPPQFEKPKASPAGSGHGFFWNAVAKFQNAHSRLDEYLANWWGLDQSRYQWALNDYYEGNNGMANRGGKQKELVNNGQNA